MRLARQRARLSLGQVYAYAGVHTGHLSEMERGIKQPTAEMIARLAKRYACSADYLLCLTDDPTPHDAPPVTATLQAIMALAREWQPPRQAELLNHARVLDEAEREADLREYDRIMDLLAALKDGDLVIEAAEAALRAHAAGDRAMAEQLVAAFFAGRAAAEQMSEQSPQEG